MSSENQLVKQIDFFRQEKNTMFYEVIYEQRKLKKQYIYERGSESYDDIIVIKIGKDNLVGVGECSPFPSFFEWPLEKVLNDLKNLSEFILFGGEAHLIPRTIASPAKSGIDLALIDLACQQKNKSVYELFNLPSPKPILISQTIEYDTLSELKDRIKAMSHLPLLKVKLGSDQLDEARLNLVNQFAPQAAIIVDVNEGWSFEYLQALMPLLLKHKVKMIEQPLKQGEDFVLAHYDSPIPIYADESFKNVADLESLNECYSGFNIKLDKVGGLTNALHIAGLCQQSGKEIMLGCLGGTSLLSTAGFVAAQFANFVDLDNHLWLCEDREPSLGGEDGIIKAPKEWLWGSCREKYAKH